MAASIPTAIVAIDGLIHAGSSKSSVRLALISQSGLAHSDVEESQLLQIEKHTIQSFQGRSARLTPLILIGILPAQVLIQTVRAQGRADKEKTRLSVVVVDN